jgi:hypothetical protein
MPLAGVVELQEFELKLAIGVGLLIMMEFFNFMKNVLQQALILKLKTQQCVDMLLQ